MVRLSLAMLFALPVCAQSLEQAAERLARKVAVTLRAAPPVVISVENRSSLSTPAERVRAILDREINKGTMPPGGTPAISAYIAENASGPILIATSDCGEAPCIAIERFKPEAATSHAALVLRSVIKQAAPVLDFAITSESLAVLETDRLALYKRDGEGWVSAGSMPFTLAVPMPRDPRGRLIVREGTYEIHTPGSLCTGATAITCKPDDSGWREGDMQLAFKPRRNELMLLPAGTTVDDFAQIQSGCGVSRLAVADNTLQATGAASLVLPGVPVALWSSETPAEASLVVRNPSTHEYEASRVAIHCDR